MKRSRQCDDDRPGRRQPQVSCDFCRAKKLKCDRGAPCQSCKVRMLSCSNDNEQSALQFANGSTIGEDAPAPSILARLTALEHAVFGEIRTVESTPKDSSKDVPVASNLLSSAALNPKPRAPLSSGGVSEHYATVAFLDSTYAHPSPDKGPPSRPERFYATPARSRTIALRDGCINERQLKSRSLGESHPPKWIMIRSEALHLFQSFLNNPYHLLHILQESRTRLLINTFYDNLEVGGACDPACAALILSVAATSASFFDGHDDQSEIFASAEDAVEASRTWMQSALDILHEASQWESGRLEECQARAILAYVIYNSEGCSARLRFQHSCSIASARDMSLHLIDSPKYSSFIDAAAKEFRRRLWWHIASTDWLLAFMGSPLDGTYLIQARHANVRLPRNVNDNEIEGFSEDFEHYADVPTQTSAFIQRIRLSEICRAIADARTAHGPDVETSDLTTTMQLDSLFEKTLGDLPEFLRLGGHVPANAPPHLTLQRDVVLLGLYTRRARLHRPFLLRQREQPQFGISRDRCLESTCIVVSICVHALEGYGDASPRPKVAVATVNKLGVVISALFTACVILAVDAGIKREQAGSAAGLHAYSTTFKHLNPDTHEDLARAYRLLAAAGKSSASTGALVRSLTCVLRQYRLGHMLEAEDDTLATSNHADHTQPIQESTEIANHVESQLSNGQDAFSDFENFWKEFNLPTSNASDWDQLFSQLEYFS